MRSYLIPRDVKGETRLLTFFTPKAFLYTIIGLLIGTILFNILKLFTLKITGIIVLVLSGLISFIIGALKIPETNAFAFFKDTGGESIDDIIWRYIKFNKDKKIYIYGRRES